MRHIDSEIKLKKYFISFYPAKFLNLLSVLTLPRLLSQGEGSLKPSAIDHFVGQQPF